MEPSESDLAAVSNGSAGNDPQLASQSAPSSPDSHHDHDPPPSDLNHVTQEEDALREELQSKLDLKSEGEEGGETEEKVSNFNDGGEQVGDEGGGVVEESGKVDGFDRDSRGWESNSWDDNVNEGVNDYDVGGDFVGVNDGVNGYEVGGDFDGVDDGYEVEEEVEEGGSGRAHQYPLRPDAEDCAFYMKTGNCKFGFNCKFNHPMGRRNQSFKDKAGKREEPEERSSQTECKYYLRSGGCKFGKACKYNHPRGKSSAAPILELNFLGLPIRLGEKECPYYMRTGSCKFGSNCKFNHPDPTTVGGGDPPSRYGNGGSVSLQGVSQPSVPSWSSRRTLNETPFVPMMLSPTQGVSPRSSDWNGYQAPAYLSDRSMHPPSAYVMSNPAIETNVYMHRQKQILVDEFPERPGEPECSYFLKTGDCKFKSNCKFHHPKNRIATLPPCNLSDKGLPLRPDQNICSHYSRYGICKFGPACKFDHPINLQPSAMPGSPGFDPQSYTNSATVELDGMGGSADVSDAPIQPSV